MEFFVEITGLIIMTAVSLRAAMSTYWLAERRVKAVITEKRHLKVLTGQVHVRLESERQRQSQTWSGTKKFQVIERQNENASGTICSFYIAPCDGQPLPAFRPGQFLTFEFPLKNDLQPAIRCYSISSSPAERRFYRITVKRVGAPEHASTATPPGMISNFLHDRVDVGNILDVRAPSGSFFLDQNSERPIVLIAGGVGFTPLISMLSWLIATNAKRHIWLFYGVRDRSEHAMYQDMKELAKIHANLHTVTFYSRPTDACRKGIDYDAAGHVSVDVLKQVLTPSRYEFYVCGPSPMMETITRDLQIWGVPHEDIKCEAFGTYPITTSDAGDGTISTGDTKPQKIHFSRSKKTVLWTPSTKSLLELAEANDIKPRFGCRAGNCGTCASRIENGQVSYIRQPGTEPASGSCLICIARPNGDVVIDL